MFPKDDKCYIKFPKGLGKFSKDSMSSFDPPIETKRFVEGLSQKMREEFSIFRRMRKGSSRGISKGQECTPKYF